MGLAQSGYMAAGTLSVLLWDIVSHLREDYLFIRRCPRSLGNAAYVLSRLGTLAYLLQETIFLTSDIKNCISITRQSISWTWPIVTALTSLLFFFRIRAVFNMNPRITNGFAVFWAIIVTAGLAVSAINYKIATRCGLGRLPWCNGAYFLLTCLYDTLIFVFISARLVANANPGPMSLEIGLREMVSGGRMLSFSRGLMRDGQIYYLTTIILQVVSGIFFIHPASNPLKVNVSIPNVALMNIMACYVFRNTRRHLRAEDEDEDEMNVSTIAFPPPRVTSHSDDQTSSVPAVEEDRGILKNLAHCSPVETFTQT